MERWTPENPENEPYVELNLPGGNTFEANRQTARLFQHLGRLAMYDHIYCTNNQVAFYIFKFVDGYEQLAVHMIENNYPIYANQTEVSDTDIAAYDKALQHITGDIDYIPDDWTK